MDKVSVDQYGRKQWDLEAHARQAREPKPRPDEPERLDPSQAYVDHRDALLTELVAAVQQHTLITSGAIGFACPVCGYSFRDDMALIDHLNSPQHIERVQGTFDGELNAGVKRASADEVRQMLLVLARGRPQRQTFEERAQRRAEVAEAKREKRRRRKRRAAESPGGDADVQAAMGFGGFGKR